MSLSRLLSRFTALAAVSILAGCATSPLSRIDANRAAYESWPIEIQEAVLNGRVVVGMTPEQVRTSVGKPTEVVNRAVQAGEDEVWVYRKGGSALSSTSISLGGSVGGIGVSGSPGGGNSGGGEEEHEVVFRNGVVSRSDFP